MVGGNLQQVHVYGGGSGPRNHLMKKLHVCAPETVLAQAGVGIPLAHALVVVVEEPKASWERAKG